MVTPSLTTLSVGFVSVPGTLNGAPLIDGPRARINTCLLPEPAPIMNPPCIKLGDAWTIPLVEMLRIFGAVVPSTSNTSNNPIPVPLLTPDSTTEYGPGGNVTSNAASFAHPGGATAWPGLGWQGSFKVAVICAAFPHAVSGLRHNGSVVCQLSFWAIVVPAETRRIVGLTKVPDILNGAPLSDGPRPRINNVFGKLPERMNPPFIPFGGNNTGARVEILISREMSPTFAAADALLFAVVVSLSAPATLAVLPIIPTVAVEVITKVMVTLFPAPGAMVPKLQVKIPPDGAPHVPWVVTTDTKVPFAGGGSVFVSVTPVAVSGPLFVTVIVNVTFAPISTGVGAAV